MNKTSQRWQLKNSELGSVSSDAADFLWTEIEAACPSVFSRPIEGETVRVVDRTVYVDGTEVGTLDREMGQLIAGALGTCLDHSGISLDEEARDAVELQSDASGGFTFVTY